MTADTSTNRHRTWRALLAPQLLPSAAPNL